MNLPPKDLDAERAVLGCLMLGSGNELIYEARSILSCEDFYLTSHELIFAKMLALSDAGAVLDSVTVGQSLTAEEYEMVGGAGFLGSLMEAVPHASHLVYYCNQVRDSSRRRQFYKVCAEAMRDAGDAENLNDLICHTEGQLHAILEQDHQADPVNVRDVIEDVMLNINGPRPELGLSTGFTDLDNLFRLEKGQLVVVAARPSHGKTAMGMGVAVHVAEAGHRVLFDSLEQSNLELTERLLSSWAGIENTKIKRCELTAQEQSLLMQRASTLADLPITLDDNGDQMTVARIGARARIHKRRFGLSLLIVDYLQLLEPENRRDPREQQVARMSRGLKLLAKSLGIPVMLLCQLNREVEKTSDRRPRLSHLRESGSIEQDADVVLLLNRPEIYDANERPGEAEVIVAKNRNGSTGNVWLQWDGPTTTFRDLSHRVMPPSFWPVEPTDEDMQDF